jgi:hypothetical protein
MSDTIHAQIKHFLATPDNAPLGPGPRLSRLTLSDLNSKLDSAFKTANFPSDRQQPVRSLVLLWHDHLDASHEISQSIENADGSLVHAIMHRREPDYWNSKYWWRRVGNHPAFPAIANRVEQLLKSNGDMALQKKLLTGGKWDPFVFVDECEAAAASGSTERIKQLQEIQRVETEAVLEYFLTQ